MEYHGLVMSKRSTKSAKNKGPARLVKQQSPPAPPLVESRPESNLIVIRDADDKRTRGRKNPEFPNINIRATAARMKTNESHLSRLLTLKTRPSLKMARKLADAFGLTLEQVERIYDERTNERFPVPGAA